jgi:hypothetical protein
MISDYLDREYVLSETRAQRDWLAALQKKVLRKDKAALANSESTRSHPAQLTRASPR